MASPQPHLPLLRAALSEAEGRAQLWGEVGERSETGGGSPGDKDQLLICAGASASSCSAGTGITYPVDSCVGDRLWRAISVRDP